MTQQLSDEDIERISQRVIERIESRTSIGDKFVLSRRELAAIAGTGLGAGVLSSLFASPATASGEGSGSIGTEQNPLAKIYVDELFQNEDNIVTSSLSGDLVDRSEPIDNLTGNIYVTEEGEDDPTQHDGDIWFEVEAE